MANTRFWTEERLNMAAAARTKKQQRQVAEYLGASVGAVRYQGGRERVRRGETPASHRWTPEEDSALTGVSVGMARTLARRWGIEERKVLRRRLELRRKGGRTSKYHIWTAEETNTLRSFPTIQEALAWAEERGLSVNTAKQRYYTGPSRKNE